MYQVESQEATPEFLKCWQAAGVHLSKQVQDGNLSWLRAHPNPPFLEHLSFRIGNQLFFIRIEDQDGKITSPGSREGLLSISKGCSGHPCLLPMKKGFLGGSWEATEPGWGLVSAITGKAINPLELVTDEPVEMTDWELHDFAVQVVRDQLEKSNFKLMSWQGNPLIDPAIWFMGDSKGPEWVVVRVARYPENSANRPSNWSDIAASCAKMSKIGHFASVAFVSAEQPFKSDRDTPIPLLRGCGVYVNYRGLEK